MTTTRAAWLLAILVAAAAIGMCQRRPAATPETKTGTAAPPTTSAPPQPAPAGGASAPTATPKPPQSEPTTAGEDPPSAPPTSPVPPLPPASLPAFPWPPPRYSAFATIAREWVAAGAQPTLASAAARLEHAFDAAGYGERSYYWVPGGFALVSRIEQIGPDATPLAPPARWAIETPALRTGFIDYVRALFNAPPGFYRVIVFAVTDQDFAAGERAPTSGEARTWISSGSLRLPASVGVLPYTAGHYTTALIYEFERRADRSEAAMKAPSNSPGQVHLEKTGLWQALARP
jgi:hypothetical protein